MKKLMTLCVVFVFLSGYSLCQINFSKFSTVDQLLSESRNGNKPVFLYFYVDWLNMCIAMENSLFKNNEVANYYNSNFICYQVDSEDQQNIELKNEYNIVNNLYFLIIDSTGKVLNAGGGFYTNANEFIAFGQVGYYKFYPENSEWKKNENEYNNGNRAPLFLKQYAISMLNGNYNDKQIAQVVDVFWEVADTSFIEDEHKIEMINLFESELDGRINFFIEKKQMIFESRDMTYYYTKLIDLIELNLAKAIQSNDVNRYNQIEKFAKLNFKDGEYVAYEELKQYINQSWKERLDK
jgi:thioredoxin-related protein